MGNLIKYIVAWFRIPRGYYCYFRKDKKCPYWDRDSTYPEQENGYCHYLGKGDWELYKNDDFNTEIRNPDGTYSKSVVKGKDLPFSPSLLWDQCKECHIKR